MGLEVGIWASNWDLGLEAGIWASRMGFLPQEWDLGLLVGFGSRGGGTEEKKKEEKIPHICESIGHRPLRGRCPAPSSTSTTQT